VIRRPALRHVSSTATLPRVAEPFSLNNIKDDMSDLLGGAQPGRGGRIALANVRVFDGRELRGPTTVVIDGGILCNDSAGARIIDAGGATLLPGLIDAHVHLSTPPDPTRKLSTHSLPRHTSTAISPF
jgi:adenine deaminase